MFDFFSTEVASSFWWSGRFVGYYFCSGSEAKQAIQLTHWYSLTVSQSITLRVVLQIRAQEMFCRREAIERLLSRVRNVHS